MNASARSLPGQQEQLKAARCAAGDAMPPLAGTPGRGLTLSIVIPAKNEAASLRHLLPELQMLYPNAEIIVVDDGSSDDTATLCAAQGLSVVSHARCRGNGASIKSGARAATGDLLLFMDADGQHVPGEIPLLLDKLAEGFDMVVGARGAQSQASLGRLLANSFYNWLASWISGHPVEDLTSGFRVVRRRRFLPFLHLLPNGFSYPTTITMAFFRAGFGVAYVPTSARRRQGRSHIRLPKDGLRFLIIIFKIGTLYSPLKIFLPVSALFFVAGLGNYLYSYLFRHSFGTMSAVLLLCAILVFLIGLVSEQITALTYKAQD